MNRTISPITFFDAIEAGQACECLEEAGIEFELKDIAEPQIGMRSFDSPPIVVLRLFVNKTDEEAVKAVLREKLDLFPLQEVTVADEPVDDGSITTLGDFGLRKDAEDVAQILDDAKIWHRIVSNPEGTVENEDCFTLEVKEIDVFRVGQLVERVLNLPEE
jgi:hypothetical protein